MNKQLPELILSLEKFEKFKSVGLRTRTAAKEGDKWGYRPMAFIKTEFVTLEKRVNDPAVDVF